MTKLMDAAMLPDVRRAAIAYARYGYSVLPLTGKRPSIDWKAYQERAATLREIQGWGFGNVGIATGPVSRLVVIDLDGLAAVEVFRHTFPALWNTYRVVTGSRKGMHLYYHTRAYPRNIRFALPESIGKGNIEAKAAGSQVVAPPSLHPDTGLAYEWDPNSQPDPRHLLDLAVIERWVDAQRRPERVPARRQAAPRPAANGSKKQRYAEAALNGELERVKRAPKGSRNNDLNRAAFALGTLVGAGLLEEATVQAALYDAAEASGLVREDGPEAVRATISSGLFAGERNPRRIS